MTRRRLFICLVLLVLSPLRTRADAMLELFNVSWSELIQKMPEIAEAGYTSLWLPPPAKGSSVYSIGYDLFDPFDLGDKNQRGTVATHWGTKAQLLQLVQVAHQFGIRVYFDNIMNHRAFDVPQYDSNTPANLYPGLIPQDFHLQTISGGYYRNWPNVEDWNNQFDVQYESLSGLIDLANEPGTVNGNFGNTLGSTISKVTFIRQPSNPDYYQDPNGPSLGGPWHPFNGTNGLPVSEYVQDYEIRAVMWTLYTTKCDGFRLDAVKHVPSDFFGVDSGANTFSDEPSFSGYTGGIQAMFDYVHGYGNNVLGNGYFETDGNRNSCFDSEAARNDALLFGEHLGQPPTYSEYLRKGMRLLNAPLRDQMNSVLGGSGCMNGMDGRDFGPFSPAQSVMFAQSHDASGCCATHRELQNAYYFMHEGVPEIYSDNYNQSGPPSYFPNPPYANYLGQFGDANMPEISYLHNQLARGGTRPRWSDCNIVAFERYDYRDVSGNGYTNADATVVFFAMNDNFGNPGDITFDDGVARTSDGYYTCGQGANVRPNGMIVEFPPGSLLSQLASSATAASRACPKLLVHRATTDKTQAQASANAANAIDRLIYVNTTPPSDGGAIELTIPSGGWVMYGYQWPEPSRANGLTNAITFRQAGAPAPAALVYRHDGKNGDPNFNPVYPFKMRGRIDPNGNVIGGINVSNLTYAIDVPVLTNASFDFSIRSDASTANILAKMDGGLDLNRQMGLGSTNTADPRDNRPGYATDVFLGYEQTAQQLRYGPEKFAAAVVSRDNVTSLGAETYYYTVGQGSTATNGAGNGANVLTATANWVYHDPSATNSASGGNGSPTQRVPLVPASGQPADVWLKVGYGFRTNHCFIYYTTDGSNPEGAFGVGKGSTQVVPGSWVTNDTQDPASDWFKATIPGQPSAVQVRYKAAFYQDNIPTISDADNSKLYGLTEFGITNFDPTAATVWLHNDLNPNSTAIGLAEGFHILRARCFLPRSGKSGVYNTFLQTFYYDAGFPSGVIVYPPTNGTVINTGTYTIVVRADSSVTEADVKIVDANGQVSGVATPVTPDPVISQSNPNLPQEYRFAYSNVPTNGSATITVTLKKLTSSLLPDRITTLTRTVSTRAPASTVQISAPADGAILVLNTNDTYTFVTCFTSTLDTNDPSLFSIYLNGILQPRTAYGFLASGCGTGLRMLYLISSNTIPGTNSVQVIYTNTLTLSDTKIFAVARPGDSDGDGMSDYAELIAGTDPYDPNSVLRITGLSNTNQLIVWQSVTNRNYQVLATTNLHYPLLPISPVVPGNGGSSFYFDNLPDRISKFYRVQVVP